MDDNTFDVIVLGTGLTESIVAAALSKSGFKIAQLDTNAYYGGDEASVSIDEFVGWVDKNSNNFADSRFHSFTRSTNVPSQSRQYSICLSPSIIPSIGSSISSLISSGVAKYNGFRLLDRVGLYDGSHVQSVPGSKEDVFKNKSISLVDKRRLMRFLTFAAGDFEQQKELEGKQDQPFLQFLSTVFSLKSEMAEVIAYALAFCVFPSDPTLPALRRLSRYLHSVGRYGPSAFLVGHYGGIGDIAQGFCRAAAVSGTVYILGREIKSISRTSPPMFENEDVTPSGYSVTLDDFPDTLFCNLLIASSRDLPAHLMSESRKLPPKDLYNCAPQVVSIARCVAIIDKPICFDPPVEVEAQPEQVGGEASEVIEPRPTNLDTALLVYPPGSLTTGSTTATATVFFTGEGAMATPKGRWIVYIALPLVTPSSQTPEDILKPYLDSVLSLPSMSQSIQPLFTTFYMENPRQSLSPFHDSEQSSPTCLVPPSLPFCVLPDVADAATVHAEATFQEAVKILRNRPISVEQALETDDTEVIQFWPPIEVEEENEDDEW